MSDEDLAKKVADRFSGMDLFAMSNLRPSDTGIEGTVIWVSEGEFSGVDSQHGPRIKVLPGTKVTPETRQNAVSVRITNPPEFLGDLPGKVKKQIVKFIDRNRDTLLRYWNSELSTREMLDLIQKV